MPAYLTAITTMKNCKNNDDSIISEKLHLISDATIFPVIVICTLRLCYDIHSSHRANL